MSNSILDAFDQRVRSAIILKPVNLKRGHVLLEVGEAPKTVTFPSGAVVSLVMPAGNKRSAECGVAGRNGVIGAGTGQSEVGAIVRLGGEAFQASAASFRQLLKEHPSLGAVMYAHQCRALADVQRLAVCNLLHSADQRLARWLLTAADLHDALEISMTHADLAEALGLQRSTVTVSAVRFQDAGLIDYRRGKVRIADRSGLKAEACSCHRPM